MDRPPPVTVEIPSDDDYDASPFPPPRKKRAMDHGVGGGRRGREQPASPLFVLIDDEPTPQRKRPNPEHTPSVVPDTPNPPSSYPILDSDASMVRCSLAAPSDSVTRRQPSHKKNSGIAGLICLESDHESGGASSSGSLVSVEDVSAVFGVAPDSAGSRSFQFTDRGSQGEYVKRGIPIEDQDTSGDNELNETRFIGTTTPRSPDVLDLCLEEKEDAGSHFDGREAQTLQGNTTFEEIEASVSSHDNCSAEDCIVSQIHNDRYKENIMLEQVNSTTKQKGKGRAANVDKIAQKNEEIARRKILKEEKLRLNEEKKQRRQEEKLKKEASKAEAAAMKKLQKEKQKWETGKFASNSIVAEIDAKVVENGSIGGHLLTRFAEKGLSFRITKNPIEGSVLWKMSFPDQIPQLSSMGSDVPYVLLLYEAEEFCKLVTNESLLDHVSGVQHVYPSFTICFLTNRLMSYVNKREQSQYKNPSNVNGWRRPPLDEVLSKLVTHFSRVHSRQCMDEAEVADHVVGLTSSLATCQFRKKLTRLSVNANGSQIPKGIDKNIIKRNVWLKALVAIPKVQARFAMAIWKKYPTMRSLLNVYLDPNKSVHEKEFLLKDLTVEELCREERRIGQVCSKRVYRILMARNGGMKTDDAENGADFFRS